MADVRIHRAESADGTQVVGRVHGQGPPLVLVHGAVHDGDTAWEALVPHLRERFTCFLPSLRGRGLSGDNPDHAPPRLQEDVDAFVESIGEAVYLVGWSAGVPWAISAGTRSAVVAAFAGYEPTIIPLMRGDDIVQRDAMYAALGAAAADGRLADAARAFHSLVCTDTEIAALGQDYFERCAPSVPPTLRGAQQAAAYEGPLSTDPEVLKKVAAPVLLLRGAQTRLGTFYADTERHIGEHVGDPHVRDPLPGLGHLGPLLAPGPIARELASFFESIRRSV